MSIQYILELSGTGFFALSGALAANEKSKPDWFGVTFIGFITSIGGGSIRDMLLGSYPLSWVADINRMYIIISAIVFSSVFYNLLKKQRKLFFIFDSLGIAMFTILGTEKALLFHVNPIIAAIMGMFTAIMGGVMRDVLTNEIPVVFRKEIYATACLAGAAFYMMLNALHINREICLIFSVLVIIAIRIVAVKYNLSLPQFKRDE
ncbi:MAG: trimeric intracellular cation channel family protein [Taibaiella sp.]|nr:trimeric intracellular cation channel family protein [Taibaiella sp.]